jgi:hypothetical protein
VCARAPASFVGLRGVPKLGPGWAEIRLRGGPKLGPGWAEIRLRGVPKLGPGWAEIRPRGGPKLGPRSSGTVSRKMSRCVAPSVAVPPLSLRMIWRSLRLASAALVLEWLRLAAAASFLPLIFTVGLPVVFACRASSRSALTSAWPSVGASSAMRMSASCICFSPCRYGGIHATMGMPSAFFVRAFSRGNLGGLECAGMASLVERRGRDRWD